MSEEDDATYRRRISEILVRHGFGWVVQHADSQISEGKPSSKQVSEREAVRIAYDSSFEIKTPRKRRASLITTEPYSEAERLDILLQGFEAAIAHRADLEISILKDLDVSRIEFQPDTPAEEVDWGHAAKAHHLDRARLEQAISLKTKTTNILTAMRDRR